MTEYQMPRIFDVPWGMAGVYAAAQAHRIIVQFLVRGVPLQRQLEAPTRFWYQCADTQLDPCPRPSRYCGCEEAPYGCGSCCSCLGGCVEQHDDAEHWAGVRRRWYGQLEPCICWPEAIARPVHITGSSRYRINPGCPHHGDVRHVCNVSALGRSTRMEGAGWRCPPCGATWVLTRVQGAEQPVRLYPTMQWIKDKIS